MRAAFRMTRRALLNLTNGNAVLATALVTLPPAKAHRIEPLEKCIEPQGNDRQKEIIGGRVIASLYVNPLAAFAAVGRVVPEHGVSRSDQARDMYLPVRVSILTTSSFSM